MQSIFTRRNIITPCRLNNREPTFTIATSARKGNCKKNLNFKKLVYSNLYKTNDVYGKINSVTIKSKSPEYLMHSEQKYNQSVTPTRAS
jgi:hypothetical protein